MSYIALYRKYRPVTFEEVVGQKHIVATIKNAIDTGKVAHAYLLCGPRGTGKTTVARLIAKAVNCTGEVKPCGKCVNCHEIQAGNHPDIVEIDAASNNGVDEIRDLVDKVKFAPFSAPYKIYIIDEVHMLTPSAFNALLKTLEDPPSHVLFILATTEVHKVLPTIISRCQRFDFARVDIKSLITRMTEITALENVKYEDGLLEEIAVLAEGGMRDALSILDQLVAYCPEYLDLDSLHKVYGLLSTGEKISLIEKILACDIDEVLAIIDKVNSQGLDIRRLTNEMIEIIKECIVYNLTKNAKLLSKCDEEQAIAINKRTNNQQLFALIDLMMDSAEKYRNAGNANLYFETCLLKALSLNSNEEEKASTAKESKKINVVVEPVKPEVIRVEKPVETKSEVVNSEYLLSLLLRADKDARKDLADKWSKIEDYCYDIEFARAATALKQSELFAVGEDFAIVRCDYPELVLQINQEVNKDKNILLMQKIGGKPRQVFAVDQDDCRMLGNEFKNLSQRSSRLPTAAIIDFSYLTLEDKKEPENPLFKVFGEDGIEVVE